MQNEIHKYGLLCATAITLLMADSTFAVESSVTPGPSVGHRPVTTRLILGNSSTPSENITNSKTILKVGDTILLKSAVGDDADGDIDKGGAYCVWYRVDPITSIAVVAKDPGPADRSCSYTIQTADVGFKIKNTIKIYSDQDVATAKGYTINPIESWPVDTISANIVSPTLPFEIIYGPDTYIDIQSSSNDSHMPLIKEIRKNISPSELVKTTDGDYRYRISFSGKSAREERVINSNVLGRCLGDRGMKVNVNAMSELNKVNDNAILGFDFSSEASRVGVKYSYFDTGMNKFPGPLNRWAMFENESIDSSDFCSGIKKHLNEKMEVSAIFNAYVDMNLYPSSPLPQGKEYDSVAYFTINDTLDAAPSSVEIRIRLRAL
ncbi:hypothetical protein PKO51_06525 [Yokenella regensburgei]|uniref:hypothetical protein n=1 Tax=Yokenella regensburgei TaxID=158877 RepID=UPI0027D9BD9D|nr:hypothetical protein [Yokenella regensburgei]MDQ4429030.1 hypothetical protein [Yokenella regensburgei]